MKARLLPVLLLLLALLLPTPAGALSFGPPRPGGCDGEADQARPSSFDLVAVADTILVAEAGADVDVTVALEEARAGKRLPSAPMLTREVLKGTAPARFDLGLGFYVKGSGMQGPWPDCGLFRPAKGHSYVLFLRRDGETLSVLPMVAATTVFLYQGKEDFATRLIRLYLDLQHDRSPTEQLSILDRMLRERLRPDANAEEQWQARQIMDHLRSISPLMPTSHLLALHALFSSGGKSPWGLRSSLYGSTFDDRPWPEFVTGKPAEDYPNIGLGTGVDRVMAALSTGTHPDAAPLFQALLARRSDMQALIQAFSHAAYSLGRDRALDLLEAHFLRFALSSPYDRLTSAHELARIMAGQLGMDFRSAAWRADPAVAKRWPIMALNLVRLADIRHWQVDGSALWVAAAAVPIPDKPEWNWREEMKTLGTLRAPQAMKWAAARLDPYRKRLEQGERQSNPNHDTRLTLALAVLIRSGDVERQRPLAATLYCAGDEAFLLLLDGLREEATDYDIAAAIVASGRLDPYERLALVDALVAIYGSRASGHSLGLLHPSDVPPGGIRQRLLEAALKGESGPGIPFTCPPGSKRSQ